MRVVFDYQAFALQTMGGVTRSMLELINGLNKCGAECQLAIKESNNIYLQNSPIATGLQPLGSRWMKWYGDGQHFRGEFRIKETIFNAIGYSMDANKECSIKLLKNQSFDVFHPTYFDSYFLDYLKKKPFVLTVHDMMPELFPEYFKRDDFQIVQKQLLCPLAAKIHVPSNKTKEDLISILGIDPEKVVVIHHGYSVPEDEQEAIYPQMNNPYILYVGNRKEYKNFIPFVLELSKVMKDFPEIRLVCAGREFDEDENRKLYDAGIYEKTIQISVSDAELHGLYRNAVAFVYPSLYEGFGLPILEAYANGCPVMLNNTSCFPEIAGDAAVYFELNEHGSDFYDKFVFLYRMSESDRSFLLEKQKSRLSLFSWKKASKSLFELYSSIV